MNYNKMEYYNQAEQKVFEELCEKYPRNSIISNTKLGNGYKYLYSDFLIVDVKNQVPLMTIEVKYCTDNKRLTEKRAFDTLMRQFHAASYPLKFVAAIVSMGESTIDFLDFTEAVLNENFELKIEQYSLPSYSMLTTGTEQKAINNEKEKQKNKIDILRLICWLILPVLFIAFFVLDWIGLYKITTLRLILLGALGVSALLPCFQEIKIGEISLQRMINKSKEETK